MRKLVVKGKGTAGALSIIHFLRFMKNVEIEWHFDPNQSPQAVGEGSTLCLPKSLYTCLDFYHTDLPKIYGTPKIGIYKKNWGKEGKEFIHPFVGTEIAYHFNAVALQNYIFDKIRDKIKVVEERSDNSDIDADFIMDCSGKPDNYDLFEMSNDIAVNSVHVTQCYWDYPRFSYTLTIARPYGWVFGIPLTNRCSIGYMYNNKFNNLDEIKEDVKDIFKEYNLVPSSDTNTFSFKNYYRKVNFDERIAYNGNASFFLEPLEATSITFMDQINRYAFDYWEDEISLKKANNKYNTYLKQLKTIILLHYYSGSVYNTPFWDNAREKSKEWMNSFVAKDDKFLEILHLLKTMKEERLSDLTNIIPEYGNWWLGSFRQNIIGLGLEDKLLKE